MSNPEKKRGCGCVGKGCIVMVIIAVLLIVLGARSYKQFVTWARTHTSGESVEVPVEKATREEYDALVKRLDAFKNAAPGSGKTLELTAHDFNVLVAFAPDWEVVRGKIQVAVEKDQIGLTGSLPLTKVPLLGDQYLNGGIYFTLSMDNKVLNLRVQSIKLKAGALSEEEVKKFSNYWVAYLTNSMLGEPVLGPVLIKAKALEVKDGIVVITHE